MGLGLTGTGGGGVDGGSTERGELIMRIELTRAGGGRGGVLGAKDNRLMCGDDGVLCIPPRLPRMAVSEGDVPDDIV